MGLVWQYKDGEVSTKSPPQSVYGFVYELTLKDGKKYIGKKAFWGTTKKNLTLKEIEALPNKRLKKWKYVTKESKWRSYTSSSKIFGSREVAEKRILMVAKSKRHLTYLETKYMFQHNVLEVDEYLNDNISGKFFRANLI